LIYFTGAHWCASIEIQVGRSDWPIGKEYQILAPTCIMMKPMDCNLGRNFACTRMFSESKYIYVNLCRFLIVCLFLYCC